VLFLLPPSESKLGGGSVGSRLDLSTLSFPELLDVRRAALRDLAVLVEGRDAAVRALGLGPRSAAEVELDVAVASSPTRRALERYTGVLFDPLRVDELDAGSWRWAQEHVVVHSALFGPVRAGDLVPAYRVSHDSRLPGASMKARWRAPVAAALAAVGGPVVDLRSEGYAALGPVGGPDVARVHVVSEDGGRRRALNHFNKKSKGLLVAALLRDRPELTSADDLVDWAVGRGIVLERGEQLTLVAESLEDARAA